MTARIGRVYPRKGRRHRGAPARDLGPKTHRPLYVERQSRLQRAMLIVASTAAAVGLAITFVIVL
jgi:hypothetical protein